MGLVVRENYAWCLVIFMGFGGAEVGDVLKSFGGGEGVAMQAKGGAILMGKEGGVLTICTTAVLKRCYWVRFYRILPFPKFLLFHLFLSTEISKVKSAS